MKDERLKIFLVFLTKIWQKSDASYQILLISNWSKISWKVEFVVSSLNLITFSNQRDPWQYIKHQFMRERNHICVNYAGPALHEDKKWNLMLQRFMRERNPTSAQFVMPASLLNTIWHVTLPLLMKRKNLISVCSAVTVFQERKIWKLMSYQFIEQHLWHVTLHLLMKRKKPYKCLQCSDSFSRK